VGLYLYIDGRKTLIKKKINLMQNLVCPIVMNIVKIIIWGKLYLVQLAPPPSGSTSPAPMWFN